MLPFRAWPVGFALIAVRGERRRLHNANPTPYGVIFCAVFTRKKVCQYVKEQEKCERIAL